MKVKNPFLANILVVGDVCKIFTRNWFVPSYDWSSVKSLSGKGDQWTDIQDLPLGQTDSQTAGHIVHFPSCLNFKHLEI